MLLIKKDYSKLAMAKAVTDGGNFDTGVQQFLYSNGVVSHE